MMKNIKTILAVMFGIAVISLVLIFSNNINTRTQRYFYFKDTYKELSLAKSKGQCTECIVYSKKANYKEFIFSNVESIQYRRHDIVIKNIDYGYALYDYMMNNATGEINLSRIEPKDQTYPMVNHCPVMLFEEAEKTDIEKQIFYNQSGENQIFLLKEDYIKCLIGVIEDGGTILLR